MKFMTKDDDICGKRANKDNNFNGGRNFNAQSY